MSKLTTTLSYSSDVITKDAPLMIEQKEWSVYNGKISKQEVVKLLKGIINSEDYQMDVRCDMTGDELIVAIYVYPFYKDLEYKLYTSYGMLSNRTIEHVEVNNELVQFRLSKAESTQYPVHSFSSVNWVLNCLDYNGDEVANPKLVVDGSNITSAYKVYGTVDISYITERHTYILTIPRREDALDNNFSAIVAGASLGFKPVVYDIKMPPAAEAFIADKGYSCGAAYAGNTSEDDPVFSDPEANPVDKITVVDYCTQKIINEFFE